MQKEMSINFFKNVANWQITSVQITEHKKQHKVFYFEAKQKLEH